jgi:hypothetical protein
MGLFDNLLGRSKPPAPDLDALFRLPPAAITLQATLGALPTGGGSVAFRAPAGRAFAEVRSGIEQLLRMPGSDGAAPRLAVEQDAFGFTWFVLQHDPSDVPGLVTDLHAVNAGLVDSGFGATLLCSLIALALPDGRRFGLVYLFKQGTFYPFAPLPGSTSQRDSMLELQIRDLVDAELPIEPELSRWFALWGAPGLSA